MVASLPALANDAQCAQAQNCFAYPFQVAVVARQHQAAVEDLLAALAAGVDLRRWVPEAAVDLQKQVPEVEVDLQSSGLMVPEVGLQMLALKVAEVDKLNRCLAQSLAELISQGVAEARR